MSSACPHLPLQQCRVTYNEHFVQYPTSTDLEKHVRPTLTKLVLTSDRNRICFGNGNFIQLDELTMVLLPSDLSEAITAAVLRDVSCFLVTRMDAL